MADGMARRTVVGGLLAGMTAPARAAAGGVLHAADFGATGDGRTDDSAAIRRALAALRQGGGTLRFAAGRTYFCGDYRQSGNVFAVDGLRDATIEGDGATLVTRSIGRGTRTVLFRLRDFRNVAIIGLNGRDAGTDLTVDWQGQYFVMAESSLGPCTGLVLEDVTVTDAVALLYVGGGRGRMRDIRVRRCVAIRCYYGMVFEENGDGVEADLVTHNCRRSYFAYGVRGHRIDVRVHHDGRGPGADACCLIKRYLIDTHDIDLRARLIGPALPFAYAVKLEQQPYDRSAPGLIAGIRIALTIDTAGRPTDHMIPLGLSSYTEAGVEERGTTANRWQGIALSGRIPADYPARRGVPLIAARVRPQVAGDIRLTPNLPAVAAAVPGFAIRR